MALGETLPSIHDAGALEAFRAKVGFDPQLVRLFRNNHYKLAQSVATARLVLPPDAQAQWDDAFRSADLELASRADSTTDGASKLVLRNRDGLLLEAVILRIQSGRTSACVSSQVGCAAKCVFCATGQMKMARSLSVAEILQQIVEVQAIVEGEGRRLRNVVFMGMGEPMHNREVVTQAIRQLIDPKWFNLSENHILVSTVGVVDQVMRFAEDLPRIGIALSLHAARQEVREKLMPLAKLTPVPELRRALVALQALRRRPVMLEYLLLDGVNDGEEDIVALLEFCRGLDVHVNLIPYNPIAARVGDASPQPGLNLQPTPLPRQHALATRLKAAGLRTTTRVSLGNDIAAACGQLVRQENLAQLRVARGL